MSIAFFYAKSYDREFFENANRRFGFEIKFFDAHLNLETAPLAKGSSAVCIFVNDHVDAPVVAALQKQGVQLIALRSAGYNNVDLQAAKDKIRIVRVPAYSPYSVAEHAVGMMLTLNRKLHVAYNRTQRHNFSIAGLLGFDMHRKTAGVIGVGNIGKVVVQILKGFGMRVLAYDVVPECVKAAGAESATVEKIYQESDIITLHCALTSQNKHMINKAAFARMKKGVMVINTGRGGLIDTKALIESLKDGKVGAAGLDVYENESGYFYEDLSSSVIGDEILTALLKFPNVLLTSHQAFFTQEALQNIAATTLQNISDFFDKEPLENEVKCN